MAGTPDPIDLAETFADTARALMGAGSLDATLKRIVEAAVDTLPGSAHAAISLIEKRTIMTAAASGDLPKRVDAIQYETDQGPCLDAIRSHEMFHVDDLAVDGRWPQFAARAADETGIRSMLCFRLFAEEQTMGALNLYSPVVAAFGREAAAIGAVFAAHAAVAISNARTVDSLEQAMASRAIIEQAKGIIMASTGGTADEAFDLLRQQSQNLNEKLRDVAADIVEHQHRHA